MTAIEKLFHFSGAPIRALSIEGSPWWVAADVLAALDLNRSSLTSLDADEKGVHTVDTLGGAQDFTVINEPGLYSLILRSRKPEAKQFKRWITHEVIPAIRKTGAYGRSTPDISTPEGVLALAQTLTRTAEELVAAKHEVAELTPLAAQARTHNLGKGDVNRQDFAREIVKWALSEGFQVKQPQVMEFLGRKLDLFVVGHRSDRGDATLSGERRGLSTTEKGVSTHNGHAYSTGKLTPKGVEYAWARIETYVREHGHLELPSKELAA